ncbi:hypothetical protein HYALB_00013924 [Hymenoscyphus albidus]|uniref:Malic acid transport protein n=1 Tax=Hymenoscyphus albidus TaxID=595503 RepID=A0A9N9M002_9HELO|nr:hypothetical protein HYALB_00013924 [Hymenoscyphus albidus]
MAGLKEQVQTSKEREQGNVGIRDRIHHFTWAWFAATMSTGGIGLLLAKTPHRFPGINTVGEVIFVFDLALFICLCISIAIRFTLFRKTLKSSLAHPTESLFFATFWISITNIISNIQCYGVPKTGNWLIVTLRVVFWIYVALTFIVAVCQYFFLFTGKPLTPQSAMPAWTLPVFPIMLAGSLASLLGPSQPPEKALPMMIAGVTFQGLGLLIATYVYGMYMSRLMSAGLPRSSMRAGMFIAVGPPSFTSLAYLGISEDLGRIFPAHGSISSISHPEMIPDIFRIVAVCVALFLWATAFWFFCISVVSTIYGIMVDGMIFHLVWWAFVFPNVGFTICTISIGNALMSEGILWVGSVMTILVIVTWIFVGFAHIRAVWRRDILWPGKDEDHDS